MQPARQPVVRCPGPAAPDAYARCRRQAVYRAAAAWSRAAGLRRVLDAGCGGGLGTAVLAAAGLEVYGIDADPAAVAAAARTYRFGRISFAVGDARATGWPDASFDAVVCVSVIEHLPDPHAVVAEARRLLRPGGRLIVVTPNRLTASPGRSRPVAGDHLWEYTPDELARLVGWRFAEVRLLGLFHGRRLRALDRLLGEPVALTLRRLPPPDRAAWLRWSLRRLRPSHFVVGPGPLRLAIDLVAVATRA